MKRAMIHLTVWFIGLCVIELVFVVGAHIAGAGRYWDAPHAGINFWEGTVLAAWAIAVLETYERKD